ncbi:MAG: hypothetical protein J5I90_13725 [Caldilineales bacterium]|nr:hypothetical protein [Caldilineales bacterium]
MKKHKSLLVERDDAETYILISLTAFAATIIAVRLFLQITGYPQLGGSVLHIAHLLWGGLALFVAVLAVLIFDNPVALRLAAILSGVGIGLFIDEVGKFITQTNDYFFPAAAPIIYGFFLLTVVLYLFVRRPDARDPERAMIRALEDLQEVLYGEFDDLDREDLVQRLELAAQSQQSYVADLAQLLQGYLDSSRIPTAEYRPNLWQRVQNSLRSLGYQLGRSRHRFLLMAGMLVIAFSAITTLGLLLAVAISPSANTQPYLLDFISRVETMDVQDLTLFLMRVAIEFGVGIIAFVSIFFFLRGRDREGVLTALIAIILSLTAVQLITFYLDQFTAIVPTLYQFGLLAVLLAYQQWYVDVKTSQKLTR